MDKGSIYVLVRGLKRTLDRNIREPNIGKGFDFTLPYFYDGMKFSGLPPYEIFANRLIFDRKTFNIFPGSLIY